MAYRLSFLGPDLTLSYIKIDKIEKIKIKEVNECERIRTIEDGKKIRRYLL